MPRRKAPPRLYLDPKRETWIIRDGPRFIRTGCTRQDVAGAEAQLAEYIGEKYAPPPTNSPTVLEVLAAYASEVVPHRVTKKNISYQIGSLSKWWAGKNSSEITTRTCRAYAATKKAAAASSDLKVLRAACKHWQKEHSPFAVQPMVWVPPTGPGRDRWLTREELARLLWAARRSQHIRRFILLAYYTGSRPGVILGLHWDQIDIKAGVMTRKRHGAVTHAKKRAPRVRLGKRILSHLRRWQRLDGESVTFLCHYEGRVVDDPHGAWRRAVKQSKLKGKITRHTLRHTRATHLMQAGVPIWEAAGALGMTVKTLESVYGHHHPDWQTMAADV